VPTSTKSHRGGRKRFDAARVASAAPLDALIFVYGCYTNRVAAASISAAPGRLARRAARVAVARRSGSRAELQAFERLLVDVRQAEALFGVCNERSPSHWSQVVTSAKVLVVEELRFTADRPNQFWAADTIRIPCGKGARWPQSATSFSLGSSLDRVSTPDVTRRGDMACGRVVVAP